MTMSQVVSFSLFRFGSWRARVWAFVMMGLARRHLRKVESINFWKLCGSGSGEGFTPIPNTSVYRDSRDMARRGKRDTRDRE